MQRDSKPIFGSGLSGQPGHLLSTDGGEAGRVEATDHIGQELEDVAAHA